jgi:molybdate transport system substrate-binding protein
MWMPKQFSAALLLLTFLAAPAGAASLTVLSPASVAPGAGALAAAFTAKTGIAVTLAGGARERVFAILKAGGPADVVLLPTNDLVDTPTVTGMTPLGRIAVGVAVKAGAKVPDISTPEKFRKVLLAAKGVAYADPAAGTSAGKMIDQMLSTAEFKGVKRVPVQGLAVTALTGGQADIALQMLPELTTNKDVAVAGVVPENYGIGVDFSAGIAAFTTNAVQAQALIDFLADRQNMAVWKENGLIPFGY